MLFIDTCYLLSLINEKAKNHEEAKILSQYINEEKTLINSTVLLEMLNRLKKEQYAKYRNKVINLLYDMDNIHYLNMNDYNNALITCKYYSFMVNYSDCTILETMKQFNVTDIVSYDSDFDKIKGIRRIYI